MISMRREIHREATIDSIIEVAKVFGVVSAIGGGLLWGAVTLIAPDDATVDNSAKAPTSSHSQQQTVPPRP